MQCFVGQLLNSSVCQLNMKGFIIDVMLVQKVINNSCSINWNCFYDMFSELTSSFFSLGWRTDEKTTELKLKYTLEKIFQLYFFEDGDL